MKFVKLQYYRYSSETSEITINLDQIEAIDNDPYDYYGNQHRHPPEMSNYDPTFSDPHSVGVCMRSGRRYALTELSGQLLKRILPMESLL